MKIARHRIIILTVITVSFLITACKKWESNYEKIEPAHIEHLENSELSKLTLTEKAIERIDILIDTVSEVSIAPGNDGQNTQKVVPYAAVLYDAKGHTWVYTNPEPLEFLRHEIKIEKIVNGITYLLEGPPTGTKVVVQGAAELYGTEYEVGH